jgi:hypothetical protein
VTSFYAFSVRACSINSAIPSTPVKHFSGINLKWLTVNAAKVFKTKHFLLPFPTTTTSPHLSDQAPGDASFVNLLRKRHFNWFFRIKETKTKSNWKVDGALNTIDDNVIRKADGNANNHYHWLIKYERNFVRDSIYFLGISWTFAINKIKISICSYKLCVVGVIGTSFQNTIFLVLQNLILV